MPENQLYLDTSNEHLENEKFKSERERERQLLHDVAYMWNLKKQNQTQSQQIQRTAWWLPEGSELGDEWMWGIK